MGKGQSPSTSTDGCTRIGTCNYMWELHMPFRLAHRINIELNGLLEDGPEGWTYNKPFIWYQFPYPAVYHGHAESTPAKLRVKLGGIDRYLWSFSGTGRGQAGFLRQAIMKECTICNRCGKVTQIQEVTGAPQKASMMDYARLSAKKLQSTFCVEPPGDSITRKSLIDSIVLGCIPVVFLHQELDMFEAFATAEEFADAVVYVPEAEVMGDGRISLWGTGTFHDSSHQWKHFQKLYPKYAEVFEALRPKRSLEQREKQLRSLFPNATSIATILSAISDEEVKRKQKALAKISHRFVIGLDDSSEDAVRILLNRIISDDTVAQERNAKSTLFA
ncbi:Probable xyloglucan galactosyltransferase GT11 (Glycosyltransferase 11) (AtGT11) [Durusdinium trenchii]|uniref:Probable xyloglucan galactosyltransferase GT11 (Glycosyltransferase 11) (AtGT11) n=1 Tax=Durusdinium trenchii TaxID=1381693 RepID=A0ABP0QB54_9DINO